MENQISCWDGGVKVTWWTSLQMDNFANVSCTF